jgi:hypothetical protein
MIQALEAITDRRRFDFPVIHMEEVGTGQSTPMLQSWGPIYFIYR